MVFDTLQIITGALLLLMAVLIIVLTIAQDQKTQDLGSAFGGGESDNLYGKGGGGSSKEDALKRLTAVLGVIFFLTILAVNIIALILKETPAA
jgi:preprotein translocase subunit SecG